MAERDRVTADVMTLGDLLVRAAARAPDAEALVVDERRVTYAQLLDDSERLARGLIALGVGRGQAVGILMPNCYEFVQVLFASALVGAVTVPINARFRTRELQYLVPHAQLTVICTSDLVADHADHPQRLVEALPAIAEAADPMRLAVEAAPDLRAAVLFGGGTRDGFVAAAEIDRLAERVDISSGERRRAGVRVRDVVAILYTSGTTANPKGCVHTHEGLVRNGAVTGRSRFHLTAADRFWDPLPMFHVSCLLPLIACLDAGATYISTTHWEPGRGLDQIEGERATWLFPAFPAITEALLDHPTFAARDLSSVRMAMTIGPPAVPRRLQAALPGAVQISTYGSTETGGVITYNELDDDADQRAETCGRPFRGIEIEIDALEGGRRAAVGEVGEILVRGYSIMEGYHRDPAATAAAIDADGWLHTGDLGSLDDGGRVSYAGRLKDMLKVGGENVAALEIEAMLTEHPAVAVAQVVGVPDRRLDEVAAAFVELRAGTGPVDPEILIEFCRLRAASFKVPRYVYFVESWPMSATKIRKDVLRERAAEQAARNVADPG
jgi:acyl-CoA synthetase (AMP-forming)/AMP-acid ligase II